VQGLHDQAGVIRVIVSNRVDFNSIQLRTWPVRANLKLARALNCFEGGGPVNKRRTLDPKALTTTIAAIVACVVMGTAVHKIMFKRVRLQPPPIESLSTPDADSPSKASPQAPPQAPKPSRVASRSLTA
jgi:hypothetical protein